jgi:hypothetical protein
MFAWKKTLAQVGLAVAVAVAGFAAEARAALVRIAEVESVGGYTIYNDKTTVWANVNAVGRITQGLVQVERRYRRGPNGPQSLFMTGSLGAGETLNLWQAIYAARPWATPRVRAEMVNTDFPDTKVTYLGRYTQTIIAGAVTPPPLPLISRQMRAFLRLAGDVRQRVADGELFVYDAAGGRAGYHRVITIHRDGKIEDVVDYASPAFAGQGYQKSGQLAPEEVIALQDACRLWSAWPSAFPGNPQMVDGIGITASFYRWGVKKSVFAGDPQGRPRDFQGALNMVESLAGKL